MAINLTDFPLNLEDLDAEWLTSMLQFNGALSDSNRVAAFTSEPLGGFASSAGRIYLEYTLPQDSAPRSLIAKFTLAESQLSESLARAFRSELYFYQHLAGKVGVQVPRCYFGGWNDDCMQGFIVLEDIVGYRLAFADPDTDHRVDAEFIIKYLARMHAVWWETAEVQDMAATSLSALSENDLFPDFAADWADFLIKAGENLAPELRELGGPLRKSITTVKMHMVSTPVTLRHGDFHTGNMLLQDGPNGPNGLVLFDWQAYHGGRGVRDLAYFLGMFCSGDLRRAHEFALVDLYHASLKAGGVRGYSLETCRRDYRLALLDVLYFLVLVISKLNLFEAQESRDLYAWGVSNISSAIVENEAHLLLT
jgi:aminoglycoside/choline kinase family phosphotransferase